MKKTGPKSLLERKDVVNNIRNCVLEGKNEKETAEYVFNSLDESNNLKEDERLKEIVNLTQKIYNWKSNNYLGLKDKIEGWQRDRKLMLAEKNIEDILGLGVNDKDSLKTVADISKFVTETLGKDNYSKRNELTGKDGKDLTMGTFLTRIDEGSTETKE